MKVADVSFVLGVLQQKGGVGKTTLALNLAAEFASNGLKVLLVDADPQGSSLAWSSVRSKAPMFPVVGMPKAGLHKDLPAIARNYDVVVIDGAPRVNDLARSAILASDFVLIPVQPSPFDVWSCAEIAGLIQEGQQFKPSLQAAFVVNRKIANTAIARDVLKAFREMPFPVLNAFVTQRIAFAEAAAQGLAVVEVSSGGMPAQEIAALAEEVLNATKERMAA
jgi:chromosome partitioning protein